MNLIKGSCGPDLLIKMELCVNIMMTSLLTYSSDLGGQLVWETAV